MSTFFTSGNLTKDPELRFTPKGTPVCYFTVADNHGGDNVTFLQIKTYGRQAQHDKEFLRKGHFCVVEGEIQTWFDKDADKGGIDFVGLRVKYAGSRVERDPESSNDRGHGGGA